MVSTPRTTHSPVSTGVGTTFSAVARVPLTTAPSGMLNRRISRPFRYTTAPARTTTVTSSVANSARLATLNARVKYCVVPAGAGKRPGVARFHSSPEPSTFHSAGGSEPSSR